ncbi:unnamed protein product [Phytophthora fragariaefolia]|uniref:Unnamed protein product n=1 Tax=Phytophthora fragariaefolia TaxID=1490495 RepID=A0A9W6TGB1_9STRA|nr:unnamed protein product [Phytophthora fragariaefolia]
MARWLSFFAEYNFTVEYKPGKQNVLSDALSRRPDYELAYLAYLESPLYELIREVYAGDDDLAGLVEALGVPNKTVDLTARQLSRLHRYSEVEGLLYYQVDGGDEPRIVVPNDEDLRHRVLYEAHDTPLSGHLGREKTYASVAHHFGWPHMYKWVRKGLEDTLRSVCAAEPTKWSTLLPQVDFALNSAVHSSTGFTPFYMNGLRYPRTPLTLAPASNLGGGGANAEDPRGLKDLRTPVERNLLSFIETGEAVRQRVRDAMAAAQNRQKKNSDRHGRANTHEFQMGDQVLLNAKNLPISAVSTVGCKKLRPRFIGPFTVIGVHGHAYTLDLPSAMATNPTFHVGLLKPYHPAAAIDPSSSDPSRIDGGYLTPLPTVPPSQ